MADTIEVEVRGLLNEAEYKTLCTFLDTYGTDKEVDDRNTIFFTIPGKTLKVTNQLNKDKAKIALKLGDIVKDSAQTEYELFFSPEQYDTAVHIFQHLGFQEIQYTSQRRINYIYKEASFSLKWSEDWDYHFEIEKMVATEEQVETTRNDLIALAHLLHLKLMDEEEFGKRCAEIDAKYASPRQK